MRHVPRTPNGDGSYYAEHDLYDCGRAVFVPEGGDYKNRAQSIPLRRNECDFYKVTRERDEARRALEQIRTLTARTREQFEIRWREKRRKAAYEYTSQIYDVIDSVLPDDSTPKEAKTDALSTPGEDRPD